MKKIYFPLLIVFVATLTACGSNFEWFPKVADTTAPTVSATVGGKTFTNNTTYHSTIPPTTSVTLSGTDITSIPVTIYYTTNTALTESSFTTYTAPVQISAYWALRFFGKDSVGNQSSTVTLTFAN